jgi:hypothetical protein
MHAQFSAKKGESVMAVLVPPAFRNSKCRCEY